MRALTSTLLRTRMRTMMVRTPPHAALCGCIHVPLVQHRSSPLGRRHCDDNSTSTARLAADYDFDSDDSEEKRKRKKKAKAKKNGEHGSWSPG